MGCFIPLTELLDKEVAINNNKISRQFGLIFLNKEELDYGIIVHECTHAALYHEAELVCFTGSYKGEYPDNNEPEERLCYKIESYVNSIIKNCIQNDVKISVNKED
jgi:hypothetical protein